MNDQDYLRSYLRQAKADNSAPLLFGMTRAEVEGINPVASFELTTLMNTSGYQTLEKAAIQVITTKFGSRATAMTAKQNGDLAQTTMSVIEAVTDQIPVLEKKISDNESKPNDGKVGAAGLVVSVLIVIITGPPGWTIAGLNFFGLVAGSSYSLWRGVRGNFMKNPKEALAKLKEVKRQADVHPFYGAQILLESTEETR